MKDVELLRLNNATLFGANSMMATAATQAVDQITYEMGQRFGKNAIVRQEATPESDAASEKQAATGTARDPEEVPSTKPVPLPGQIREMIYRLYVPSTQDAPGLSGYSQFVIPLGRLCVAQFANTEKYATRRIVMMDITSPSKALWLLGDFSAVSANSVPYRWLQNHQWNLLNFKGQYNIAASKLADDINLWDVGSYQAGGDDDLSGSGLLDWEALQVPDTLQRKVNTGEVIFDLASEEFAAKEIEEGWRLEDQSKSREHSRNEQGGQADEPPAKRSRSDPTWHKLSVRV